MNRIQKKTEYALIILGALDNLDSQGRISARKLAQIYTIPFELTAKILQELSQKQWVHSVQGMRGGYQLKVSLDSVTLLDLHEIMVGPVALVQCLETDLAKNESCHLLSNCPISKPMNRLNNVMRQFYGQISIGAFLRDEHNLSYAETGAQ